MTTMARVDETLARFDRKSPREAYKQVCGDLGVHVQRDIYLMLPDAPLAYHRIIELDLSKCLLGTRGCMALLPIITVSTTLRALRLRECGVGDEFVTELCEILQGHPSIRDVDIAQNPLVTLFSASAILNVMRTNLNLVTFDTDGTHVGANASHIIRALGEKNREAFVGYYQDSYFRMKDLFNYLDENGNGWVPLRSLVLNCPYPVLQEQLIERIAVARPRRRSDSTVSLNTFLELVYANYKTESEIANYAASARDNAYVFIVANWKQLLAAVARHNASELDRLAKRRASRTAHAQTREGEEAEEEEAGAPLIALPAQQFHRLRLRQFLLTDDDADLLLNAAVRAALADGTRHIAESATDGSAPTLTLPIQLLQRASRTAVPVPACARRPKYAFYTDRGANYIPDCLRSGSRVLSLGQLSMLDARDSVTSEDDPRSAKTAKTRGFSASVHTTASANAATDEATPAHSFALPASIVRLVIDFFNKEYAKLPPKRASALPDTPRTRKDKAMEKAAIRVATFLSAEFVTDLERVKASLLSDYFARYSLPVEDSSITLQEMVNVLDELYVSLRVDTIMSLEYIEKELPNPLELPQYGEFLAKHLQDRDEDTHIVTSLRHKVSY